MYYPYSSATPYVGGTGYPAAGTAQTSPVPTTYMQPAQQSGFVPSVPSGGAIQAPFTSGTQGVNVPGLLPVEESYIENILRLNLGKVATIYMTFENNSQWNAKVFKGKLEAAGRDHIIISDPRTGERFLLLMVNLDYITFDEELNYDLPFGSQR